ncbi:MAG: hypothetical protein ACRCYU_01505 [Nocardioides sp.]
MTAFCGSDELDAGLIEMTMTNALAATDHTELVYQLGGMMRIIVGIACQGTGEGRAELTQSLAHAVMSAVERDPRKP